MSILSNDPDENPVDVTLDGTGTQPPPPPAPRPSPAMPTPARILVKYLQVSPQQAYAGQPATISANMANAGDSAGGYTATLKINGQVEQTKIGSVDGHSAVPVTFTVYKSQPGTYTVDISGQKGSFTILGGGTSGSPGSGGLIAILVMGILVLLTVVVLFLAFRRPA